MRNTFPKFHEAYSVLALGFSWRENWKLISVLLVAALAYFANLGAAPLWYDESGSAWMSSLPLPQLLAATAADTHPPLYLILLWVMQSIFGPSAFALRLLSALCALGVVYVAHRLALTLELDERAHWLGMGLMVLSAWQLVYAQEARMYALFTLLVLAALDAALNMRLLRFVLLSALALYTHNYALIYLAVNCGVLAWRMWEIHQHGRWPVSTAIFQTGVIAAAALWLWWPWADVLYGQMQTVAGGYWILPITPGAVIDVVIHWLAVSFMPDVVKPTGVLVALGLLGFVLFRAARLTHRPALILAWFIFAPLAAVVLGSIIWKPFILFRGFAPSVPALWLLAGWAFTHQLSPRRTLLALALLVPVMALALHGYYARIADNKGAAMYAAAAEVAANWQAGDVLIHANEGTLVDSWGSAVKGYPAYVLPQCSPTVGGLSAATQKAMGIQTLPEGAGWRRAWFVWSWPPTVKQCNVDDAQAFIAAHTVTRIIPLRNDALVQANVYLLEP